VGDRLEFGEVLLVSDGDQATVGQPFVEGGAVKAEVIEQFKGKKIIVFKYRPKQRYRRKAGHRQLYTRLVVRDIVAPSASGSAPKRSRSKKSAEPAGES
jgi:large subunit ribosomal protein L21